MRLKITHETAYRYETPVRNLVQSLRLTPSVYQGQRVIDWSITLSEGEKGPGFRDGAGDWVQGWTVRGPIEHLTIRAAGEIETTDLAGILRGHREQIHPLAYLRGTAATEPDEAIRDLASQAEGEGLDLAHALSRAVKEAIRYSSGVTRAHTSAAEALQLGEGVCQDHAHALIATARARELPARYVSGYLHTAADGSAHESAHAWAEIHVEGLGWVGFDAANGVCPDERYIRTGSGLDSRDAAPIRGTRSGVGPEHLDAKVAVERLDT